jgi:nucleotide-binding universal stress UspA family protein
METFVVATDLSERSDRAMARAFDLAPRTNAKLIVVHAIDNDLPAELSESQRKIALKRLERQCAQAVPGVKHELRVVDGYPSDAVADIAAKENATLLILGIHRPRAFADAIHATTMQEIVRLVTCPVLLVREPGDHAYTKVLGAVDFSAASADALLAAAHLLPSARIIPFHAYHAPYRGLLGEGSTEVAFRHEAEAAAVEWRKTHALPDRLGPVEIIEGSASQVLDAEIARHAPDLLALGAHARSGLQTFVLGSFARRVMANPPTDLLVVPPQPRRG